ncbi:putative protease s8 tripeptidyl peptidase [Phaeomoniella chlamydospora]|uniref:tripeptidyl-peptidase II n=1 Tax=Phaeomoniella chlamydospora TaxID=158046 RepID=A0A0G2F3Q2_PHACM|nr:putative protease s8 tripeptidyl peptidase [Phaeomoniella chlamydospora]
MRFLQGVLAATTLVAFSEALPKGNTHSLHEKRSHTPSKWQKRARVEREAILPVRIGLTQTNLEEGHEYLMDVSHPNSSNFGKHWTAEQVHDAFAPTEEAIQLVREWLISSGIEDRRIIHSENKGWIALEVPVETAERLFLTEYYEHEHIETGKIRIGSDEYHVPTHIKRHIDYITPGVKFSAPLKKRSIKRSTSTLEKMKPAVPGHKASAWTDTATNYSLPTSLQGCATNVTPPCIRALYSIPIANRSDSVNSMGIYEDGDIYAQSDIDLYFATYAPQVPQGTHPIPAFIDGATAPVSADSDLNTGESDIDLDMAYSLIYPQTVTLYQTDDLHYEELEITGKVLGYLNTFLDALDGSYCNYTAYGITGDSPDIDPTYPDPPYYNGTLQCGVYTPTRVISISYGEGEADLPVNYQKRQCSEFLKLGLQGHTFTISTGDYGVASYPGDVNSTTGCLGTNQDIYSPNNPVNCPYVLAVGATQIPTNGTVYSPEISMQDDLGGSASLFASAGGFANFFEAPDYQTSALSHYFEHHDPGYAYYTATSNGTGIGANNGIYNRVGRGYPDVSANGAKFPAFMDGELYHFYGTSLAAPLWGSIITLINEERTAIGKGPVGFVNPTLYENTDVFNDITSGSNPGCGSGGFEAVEGWDPVTG